MDDRRERGVALLVALMVIFGLVLVGQMAMLVMDNVTQRGGTFRRVERSQYCAEEALNLGRAWVQEYTGMKGSLPTALLSGTGTGNGLLTDPTNPNDFGMSANGIQKDLCLLPSTSPTSIGGLNVYGLQGICRTDSAGKPLYRINLVDDIDEPPSRPVDPFTDVNQTFLIRAECMDGNYQTSALAGCAVTTSTGGQCVMDQVESVEVAEAGGGCPSSSLVGAANPAGCGVGNK